MFQVSVSGWFAAAHQLRLPGGTLEPLHGHNWHVRVTFEGDKLDSSDCLVDFTDVQPRLNSILQLMHDRNLNELDEFRSLNPSAERVAMYVATRICADLGKNVQVREVEVEEAPGCVARYFPGR